MAASGSHIQRLRDEATCSICLDYFKDPVTIPECGHNFCRSCLIQCWGESEAEASCPQCRERVQRRSLIPNRQLANVVEIAKNLSLQEVKKEGGEGGVCEDHQEPLKLFCKEDEAPICVVCDRSKEHKHHEVIPLKEAFEEYKELAQFSELLHSLQPLRFCQFLQEKRKSECGRWSAYKTSGRALGEFHREGTSEGRSISPPSHGYVGCKNILHSNTTFSQCTCWRMLCITQKKTC